MLERASERIVHLPSQGRGRARRAPKGLGVPEATQPGRGPPLFLPGAGGGARAEEGLLLSASAASFSNPVFTQSEQLPWQPDLRACAYARRVSRVLGGSGVARGEGGGATRPDAELVRTPPSSAGLLPEGSSLSAPAPVAPSFRRRCRAPRRVSAAQRGVALGRRSLGGESSGARRLGAPRAASSRPWTSLRALPPPLVPPACSSLHGARC